MFLHFMLHSALIILVYMTSLFLIASWIRDNSIVDIFWGLGFLVITSYTLFLSNEITLKKIISCCLMALWGLRLSIHIYLRKKGQGEDFRYLEWRKQWKHFLIRSYFQVFLLQGVIMLLVESPLILINSSPSEHFGVMECIGIMIFIVGFTFETIGDLQLTLHRKKPENRGLLITSGLWKYSRHPNYFGEALLWWGIWIMAIPEVNSLFTIISPFGITILIRYISGVPLLERKYEGRADWEEYKSKVPPFIPWFRKLS
jgi:steroid 5-alpha reductase family enzyme